MKIVKKQKTHFKECENTTVKKILFNICDVHVYGLTDSNIFYRNMYTKPQIQYDKLQMDNLLYMGSVFLSYELSYHIIANIVCVELPKTTYNLIPFKYQPFKNALRAVRKEIINQDIKEIHTPIFGTKIIEGDWIKISNIITETFQNIDDLTINIYE